MSAHSPTPGDGDEVADLLLGDVVEALTTAFAIEDPPPVGAALSEFVDSHLGVGADPRNNQLSPFAQREVVYLESALSSSPIPDASRRESVFPSTLVFCGNFITKVLVGGTLMISSVGGAHALGVLDVPYFPDRSQVQVVSTASAPVTGAENGSMSAVPTPTSVTAPAATDESPPVPVVGPANESSRDDKLDSLASPQASPSPDESPSPSPDESPSPSPDESPSPSPDESPSPSPDESPSPSPDDSNSAEPYSASFTVLEVGEVTIHVDGLSVSVVSMTPNDGWGATDESHEPGEAEVSFRNGDDRVDFKAEISHGDLRIRTRDRRTDTRTDSREDGPDADDDDSGKSDDDDDDEDDG